MYATCTGNFLYNKNCHVYIFLICNYLILILVQEIRERKVLGFFVLTLTILVFTEL